MIKKILNILNIAQQILQGIYKSIFKDPNTEKVAKYRMSVCTTCPKQGYLINTSIFNTNIKLVKQCKECKCLLLLKSHSFNIDKEKNATCPLGLWAI
jgi:hypothetical protein